MVCPGDTIRILEMDGHPEFKYKTGVVQYVDDDGQMFGTWGSLGVVPDRDRYLVVGNDGEKHLNRALLHSGILVTVTLSSIGILSSDIVPGLGKILAGFIFGAVVCGYSLVAFGILRRG